MSDSARGGSQPSSLLEKEHEHNGILDAEDNGDSTAPEIEYDAIHASTSHPTYAEYGPDLEKQHTNKSKLSLKSNVPSVNDVSSVPNGGTQAWLQVLGCFFIFFNSWGLINTFGNYQTVYETGILRSSSPADIAWIGSIQAFLLMAIGPVVGPIYDAGYARLLVGMGSFLIGFGLMMTSLCTEYYQVFLAQGLCVGIGTGFIFTPGVAILSTYFSTRLATATGIAASGSSLGGVLYPIMLNQLIPEVGLAWSTRIVGFLALATLLVSNVVLKVRVLPASKRKVIDWVAFAELPYVLYCLGALIGFLGLYAPFFYVEYYCISKNITSESLAFYAVVLINAGSVFGRIFPNLVADVTGPMNMITPAAILSGVLCICLIPAKEQAAVLAICVLFGFFSGTLVSLPATIIVSVSMHRRGMIGTRMGVAFFISSTAVLLGAPICGWILDASSYTYVWLFGGVMLATGGIIMGTARLAKTGWTKIIAKA